MSGAGRRYLVNRRSLSPATLIPSIGISLSSSFLFDIEAVLPPFFLWNRCQAIVERYRRQVVIPSQGAIDLGLRGMSVNTNVLSIVNAILELHHENKFDQPMDHRYRLVFGGRFHFF